MIHWDLGPTPESIAHCKAVMQAERDAIRGSHYVRCPLCPHEAFGLTPHHAWSEFEAHIEVHHRQKES